MILTHFGQNFETLVLDDVRGLFFEDPPNIDVYIGNFQKNRSSLGRIWIGLNSSYLQDYLGMIDKEMTLVERNGRMWGENGK